MTVSRLRLKVPQSETREIAERYRTMMRRAAPEAWVMNDSRFFVAFVVLAAAIALAALLR
jgi:hypothetical protein